MGSSRIGCDLEDVVIASREWCDLALRNIEANEIARASAMQRRIGRFELAEGGTIFLDEIGELSATPRLPFSEYCKNGKLSGLGGRHPIHVDVRVIAATNRDLKAAVASGAFRQDLYYRLNLCFS
jgi:transcriptional regulator with GAF, ATPase, and Fis domain